MIKVSGKHEQKNNSGLTLSVQQALKIFRKQLFHATLADLASSARVCQTSQPYNGDGKQYEPTRPS